MRLARWAAALVVPVAIGGFVGMALSADQPKQTKDDIWRDEPVGSRQGWWRWDLPEDAVNKVMEGLRQRDPAKADELQKLREKDPEKFKSELRVHGRPEIEQLARDYWELRRQKRNAEFVEWLKTSYPDEEQALTKLKDGDPQIYMNAFDHLQNRYGYIFEAYGSSPELGAVLKEDLDLKKRCDELCRQLRDGKSEAKKQEFGAELEQVVARRYDLIVRRKEIACEQLLKRLEGLQKQIQESKDEISTYKDDRVKQENVRQRVRSLTENKTQFKWD
jgi:hypothetical protein